MQDIRSVEVVIRLRFLFTMAFFVPREEGENDDGDGSDRDDGGGEEDGGGCFGLEVPSDGSGVVGPVCSLAHVLWDGALAARIETVVLLCVDSTKNCDAEFDYCANVFRL